LFNTSGLQRKTLWLPAWRLPHNYTDQWPLLKFACLCGGSATCSGRRGV